MTSAPAKIDQTLGNFLGYFEKVSFINRPFPASFYLFSSFLQTVNNCFIKFVDDWI